VPVPRAALEAVRPQRLKPSEFDVWIAAVNRCATQNQGQYLIAGGVKIRVKIRVKGSGRSVRSTRVSGRMP